MEPDPNEISKAPQRAVEAEKWIDWFFEAIDGPRDRKLIASGVLLLVLSGLAHILSDKWWIKAASFGLGALCLAIAGIIRRRRRPFTTGPLGVSVQGLRPYGEHDHDLFLKLGRGREIDQVTRAISDPTFRIGILTGPSGCGKTSFMRAGIMPKLKSLGIEARYLAITQLDHLPHIADELKYQQPRLSEGERTAEAEGEPERVLLLDQFEQFFVHHSTQADRRPLAECLAKWYRANPPSRVKLLVCVRLEDNHKLIELQESIGYTVAHGTSLFVLSKFSASDAINIAELIASTAKIGGDLGYLGRLVSEELADPDGLVSPADIQVVLMAAQVLRLSGPGQVKAIGGIQSLLGEHVRRQLNAARQQSFGNEIVPALVALSDLVHDRRAGLLTIAEIAGRHPGKADLARLREAVAWLADPHVRLILRERADGSQGENEDRFQLVHEHIIPAVREAAGYLLEPQAMANKLLDQRVREWISNQRSPRFTMGVREYVFVKRHWTSLDRGENWPTKEEYCETTRRRLVSRWLCALAILPLAAFCYFVAWPANFFQEYVLRKEVQSAVHASPSSGLLQNVALAGDLGLAAHAARSVDPGSAVWACVEAARQFSTRRTNPEAVPRLLQMAQEAAERTQIVEDRVRYLIAFVNGSIDLGQNRSIEEALDLAERDMKRVGWNEAFGGQIWIDLIGVRARIGNRVRTQNVLKSAVQQATVLPRPVEQVTNLMAIGKAAFRVGEKQIGAETISAASQAAESLGDVVRSRILENSPNDLALLAIELKEPELLVAAERSMLSLSTERRLGAIRSIAVAMAELGGTLADLRLLGRAHELARNLPRDAQGSVAYAEAVATTVRAVLSRDGKALRDGGSISALEPGMRFQASTEATSKIATLAGENSQLFDSVVAFVEAAIARDPNAVDMILPQFCSGIIPTIVEKRTIDLMPRLEAICEGAHPYQKAGILRAIGEAYERLGDRRAARRVLSNSAVHSIAMAATRQGLNDSSHTLRSLLQVGDAASARKLLDVLKPKLHSLGRASFDIETAAIIQSMARLAVLTNDPALLNEAEELCYSKRPSSDTLFLIAEEWARMGKLYRARQVAYRAGQPADVSYCLSRILLVLSDMQAGKSAADLAGGKR